ncbi:MAG: hypothetical protein RLZZ292_2171 [Bacteroidota bacterium]|jgi:hypothetical protein
MKKNNFFFFFFFLFFQTLLAAQQPLLYGQRILRTGTLVVLIINKEVRASETSGGETVALEVQGNVTVGGETFILTGSYGIGEVSNITETTTNYAQEITLLATHVQAVDGSMIALRGEEQAFKARNIGDEAVIHKRKTLLARVMNDTIIKLY